MADRLRSNRPTFLTAPVPDWMLPAPFADVRVTSDELSEWVHSRGRRPIIEPFERDAESSFLPSPSHGIESLIDGSGQSAIDLGCGAGRDAYWLQRRGWDVLGVDRLPPQAEIPFIQANLHEFRTERQFDLVLLHYCWDPEYLKLAMRLCVEGGRVSILAHSEQHWRCFGHPRKSKVFSESGFVNVIYPGLKTLNVQRASEFSVIKSEEFWSLDRHSVQIVLERRK